MEPKHDVVYIPTRLDILLPQNNLGVPTLSDPVDVDAITIVGQQKKHQKVDTMVLCEYT